MLTMLERMRLTCCVLPQGKALNVPCIIEGLRAKRAYIGFLADFHFFLDRANFRQTELF